MSKLTLNMFFPKLVDWLFRRRDPEILVIRYCLVALAPTCFTLLASLAIEHEGLKVDIDFGPIEMFAKFIALILLIIIVICFVGACIRFTGKARSLAKRRVFVIEGRGLRDDDGQKLVTIAREIDPAVQASIPLDLRQKVNETIVSPQDVLPKIAVMREALNQQKSSVGAENAKVVYGGLTPIPFTVMTGIELDDEGQIEVVDWDRQAENWRRLDDEDDLKPLIVSGLDKAQEQKRVVLAVAISYPINDKDLNTTFEMPVIRMELEGMSSNSHWSHDKQSRLAIEFLEICKKLSAHGVEEIHLVLAAPNSMSFNLGRRYDRRNLPYLYIYQYERSADVKYPWSVNVGMPEKPAKVVYTDLAKEGFADSLRR